jgi:hypothetical protein
VESLSAGGFGEGRHFHILTWEWADIKKASLQEAFNKVAARNHTSQLTLLQQGVYSILGETVYQYIKTYTPERQK